MATKLEKEHMGLVAQLGCIVCKSPAIIHHINNKTMGKKNSNFKIIPLCPMHHNQGGHGIAVHAGLKTWEQNFMPEQILWEQTNEAIYGILWKQIIENKMRVNEGRKRWK